MKFVPNEVFRQSMLHNESGLDLHAVGSTIPPQESFARSDCSLGQSFRLSNMRATLRE